MELVIIILAALWILLVSLSLLGIGDPTIGQIAGVLGIVLAIVLLLDHSFGGL